MDYILDSGRASLTFTVAQYLFSNVADAVRLGGGVTLLGGDDADPVANLIHVGHGVVSHPYAGSTADLFAGLVDILTTQPGAIAPDDITTMLYYASWYFVDDGREPPYDQLSQPDSPPPDSPPPDSRLTTGS